MIEIRNKVDVGDHGMFLLGFEDVDSKSRSWSLDYVAEGFFNAWLF